MSNENDGADDLGWMISVARTRRHDLAGVSGVGCDLALSLSLSLSLCVCEPGNDLKVKKKLAFIFRVKGLNFTVN